MPKSSKVGGFSITPKMPKSELEYRQQKANCNLYERTWRKTHKKQHEKNSLTLITAIKTKKPVKQAPKPKPKAKAKQKTAPAPEPVIEQPTTS